ncbi:hypothetical protein [Flavobacterium sp. J27]|uniref:hypothetical protein n=1 Tax=Flavobacterium sp. J27 TaxID=2060419 RepID=UPI001030AFE2|nr:hypothetical protein [Flavobacterium sp. J27]
MKTIITKSFIQGLSKEIKYTGAGTGSVYLEFKNKKIRISNHEPNEAMKRMRGKSDLEIYITDLVGNPLNDKFDILEIVSKFFKLEITGTLKASLTKHLNKKAKEQEQINKYKKDHKQFLNDFQTKQQELHGLIKKVVGNKINNVKVIIKNAVDYGNLGSNSSKRNQRRRSFFKQEFKKQFGIEVELSDVKDALLLD